MLGRIFGSLLTPTLPTASRVPWVKPLRKDAPEASEALDSSMSSDPCAVQAQAGMRNMTNDKWQMWQMWQMWFNDLNVVLWHIVAIRCHLLSWTYCLDLDAVTLRPAFLTPKVVGAKSSFEGRWPVVSPVKFGAPKHVDHRGCSRWVPSSPTGLSWLLDLGNSSSSGTEADGNFHGIWWRKTDVLGHVRRRVSSALRSGMDPFWILAKIARRPAGQLTRLTRLTRLTQPSLSAKWHCSFWFLHLVGRNHWNPRGCRATQSLQLFRPHDPHVFSCLDHWDLPPKQQRAGGLRHHPRQGPSPATICHDLPR